MMLPMTETMKVSKLGSILRVLTEGLEERQGMMSVLGQSVRGRRGKVLTLESVVENTGYSGERKRVSKLRGEVSEGVDLTRSLDLYTPSEQRTRYQMDKRRGHD